MDARRNGKAGQNYGGELDLRALISELALPVAVFARSDGGITFVEMSRGFETLHGLQRHRSLRRPVHDILSEEIAQPLEHSARSATTGGEVLRFQADVNTNAGAPRTCEYAVSAGENGSVIVVAQPLEGPRPKRRQGELLDTIGPLHGGVIYIFDLKRRRVAYATQHLFQLLGYPPMEVGGIRPTRLVDILHPDDLQRCLEHLEGLRLLRDGAVSGISARLRHANGQWRWIDAKERVLTRDRKGEVRRVIGVAFDVTERRELNDALATASEALLHSEELERRRIARELHDSTAQLLTAAGLVLSRVEQGMDPERAQLLREVRATVRAALREIRTFSYLLHPPDLAKRGLAAALERFVSGFERRTSLPVRLAITGSPRPLSAAVELALFRIAQEALMNVHKHARASRAQVRLRYGSKVASLEIEDDGVGLGGAHDRVEASLAEGVGLASMRSRMALLGGHLVVAPRQKGVAVRAMVRLSPADGATGK
jgi:PAS domain S-box-containing protein